MNNYIEFKNLEEGINKNTLKTMFISDLDEYSNKDNVSNILKSVLTETKYKGKIRINFLQEYINGEICYLIIISGNNDFTLLQLGLAYNFPRGFPIIWIPNKILNMYGFYPKFENDKNREESLNKKIFENSIQMNFNFKYSGFLGQVISFEINNINYWTTCAKNSTCNIYSQDVYRLIKSSITTKLLDNMCENNIHFCGETMSKYDQVHGAEVKKEVLVITLVSKGHWLKRSNNIIIKGSYDSFIEPFNQEDMHNFCIENNLNVDNIYKIRSYDSIFKFMIGLNNIRNFISLDNFNTYWNNFILSDGINCEIKNGNILHKDILGNILEGLIIKLIKNDNTTAVIKYKFPFYTSRTFLLRTYLNDCISKDIKIEESHDKCFTEDKINIWRDTYEKYIKNWVVNDNMNGKKYWEDIFENLFNNYDQLNQLYKKYVLSKTNTNKLIAKHIFLMDELFKMLTNKKSVNMPNIKDSTINLDSLNHENNMKKIVNIIFIFGPVGSGKSTTGKLIESINPELFKHIDGDLLDLDNIDLVMKLSKERNDYTKYKVIEQIINNKIPILSTGGGALFSGYGKEQSFDFVDNLNKIFGNKIDIKVTIFLPSRNEQKIFIPLSEEDIAILHKNCKDYCIKTDSDKNEILKNNIILSSIKNIYNDRLSFNSTSEQRGYSSKLADEIFKKTRGNFNLIINIIKSLMLKNINNIIFYPIFNKETYQNKIQNSLLINSIKPIFSNIDCINLSEEPKFQQKRLLTSYQINNTINFGHVTLDYNKYRLITLNNSLNFVQNINVEGNLYTCYLKDDIDMINTILIKAYELLEDNEKLIQIKSGTENSKKSELNSFINSLKKILNDYNEIEKIDLKELNKIIGKYIIRFYKNISLPKFDKKCILVVFPDPEIFYNNNISNYAHITVNPGSHQPDKMKFVAEKIYNFLRGNSNPSINNLETLDKKNLSYLFNKGIPINVKFYNIFYI